MKNHWDTVYLLGPPASGKTTVGRAVAEELGVLFRTIDDWTPKVGSISDAQVELALSKLFRATNPTDEIIEFCHHDYLSLFSRPEFCTFRSARKIVFCTPLKLCLERNSSRRSPVQSAYVERAWRSTQQLLAMCLPKDARMTLLVDTSEQVMDVIIAAVSDFVTKKGSSR